MMRPVLYAAHCASTYAKPVSLTPIDISTA